VAINGKPVFVDVDTEAAGASVVKEQGGVLPMRGGYIEIAIRGVPGAKAGGRLGAIEVAG
jgi:hypothetical protein